MLAHEQARIRVDAGHPVDRPFEGSALWFPPGDLHEVEGLAGVRSSRRTCLVIVPAAVVERRRANHSLIGLQPCEISIAPMGSALAGQLGVIGLGNQNKRT